MVISSSDRIIAHATQLVAGADGPSATGSLVSFGASPSFLPSGITSAFDVSYLAISVAALFDLRDMGPAIVVPFLDIPLNLSNASLDRCSPACYGNVNFFCLLIISTNFFFVE